MINHYWYDVGKNQYFSETCLLYCVDLEVWSKLAKCVRIMHIASIGVHDFDCEWQRVNAFSHCVTSIRVLLSQIISYSDTKVPVLVVMECKLANVIYVYQLIFLLHTSRSAECRENTPLYKQYGTAKCPCLTCISSIY